MRVCSSHRQGFASREHARLQRFALRGDLVACFGRRPSPARRCSAVRGENDAGCFVQVCRAAPQGSLRAVIIATLSGHFACTFVALPLAFHAAVLFVGACASCVRRQLASWHCLAGASSHALCVAALYWCGLFCGPRARTPK